VLTITPRSSFRLDHRPYHTEASPDHSRIVAVDSYGHGSVIDHGIVRRIELPEGSSGIALDPHGSVVCVSSERGLLLVDTSSGETLTQAEGSFQDCRFAAGGGRLWVTRRREADAATIELRDGRTLAVELEQTVADPFDGGSHFGFFRHPDPLAVAVWVAAGQDGQCLAWAHVRGEQLEVSFFPDVSECSFADMAPDGRSFVIVVWNEVRLYSYPQGALLKSAVWPSQGDDDWPEWAFFAGLGHAIVQSTQNRMRLLDLGKAQFTDEVAVVGYAPRPVSEIYPRLADESGLYTDLGIHLSSGDGRFVSTRALYPSDRESGGGARADERALPRGEVGLEETIESLRRSTEELKARSRSATGEVVTWELDVESLGRHGPN